MNKGTCMSNHNGFIQSINTKINAVDLVTNLMGIPADEITSTSEGIRFNCPLHGGTKRLSLTINTQTNWFYCQNSSCNEKGDLVSLYAKHTDKSNIAAARELETYFVGAASQKKDSIQPAQKLSINPTNITFIWESTHEGTGHSYFREKGIEACPGLRYGPDKAGNHSVVVPFRDIEGNLKTVQYIHESGKFWLNGAAPKGTFFLIGDLEDAKQVFVAEGIATAITIWNAGNKLVPAICCGPAHNIEPVINAIRSKYPDLIIIACPDADAAGDSTAASIKSIPNVYIRQPNFEGVMTQENDTDFNDLLKLTDIETVNQQLKEIQTMSPTMTLSNPETKKKGSCISASEALKNIGIIDKIKTKVSQHRSGIVSLSGISTGYDLLDDIIDGLQEEYFIVLAGRTGMGKSWAALNLVRNIAINQNIPTALFSLEMSNYQVMIRLISMESGISVKKIRKGTISDEELNDIVHAIGRISASPLYISDDTSNSTLGDLIENLNQECQNNMVKLVIIDHIGLIKQNENTAINRTNEVGAITRAIKIAAKRLKIPILCLAQLNRNADTYETPKLSWLREPIFLEIALQSMP